MRQTRATRSLPRSPLHRFSCFLLASATLVLAPAAARATAMFMGLGVLPGADSSMATGISADGSTVVGNSGGQAFQWTAGTGMVPIGIGSANAISGDASTVVGACGSQACSWTAGGGAVPLGTLPGQGSSTAYGVSADGSTIVGVSGEQAFRWTAATGMVGLGFLPGQDTSIAYGVSADGSTIVGSNGGLSGGFRWTAASGMVALPPLQPDGELARALAISADGSTIVGSGDVPGPEEAAFLWKNGGPAVNLDRFPFTYTIAYAVSADGSTIVGCGGFGADCQSAFIWDAAHGTRDLRNALLAAGVDSVADWETGRGTGVSADGRTIVGWGSNDTPGANGRTEAWIARIPEPASDALLLVGLLGLAVARRRW